MSKRAKLAGLSAAALLLACWSIGLFWAPGEKMQGEVYRIIYLHVPAAITAFFAALILFIISIGNIRRPQSADLLHWGRATAEIGLLFTAVALVSGSLWGKPTWGVYWTWDARLTTTLLLAFLYSGYLFLHNSMPLGPRLAKTSGVLGIIIFVDVPIIYQSVNWWRTLHQPQSILRRGGSTMDPEILNLLITCIVIMVLVSAWLIHFRSQNLKIKEQIESLPAVA